MNFSHIFMALVLVFIGFNILISAHGPKSHKFIVKNRVFASKMIMTIVGCGAICLGIAAIIDELF